MPPIVLPLVALLLVFLSSITQQQAAFSLADRGYVGNLDHLVAISHNESIRALSGSSKNDASADGDLDLPEWLTDYPVALQATFYRNTGVAFASEVFPPPPRFLLPLLRAPPLA